MSGDGKPDLYAVLDHYGWEQPSQSSGWRAIKCHIHGDRHASASVNYDEGRVYCHACGFSGDAYDVIQSEEGISDFNAAKRIGEEKFGASGPALQRGPARKQRRAVPSGAGRARVDSGWVPPWRRKGAAAG